MIFGNSHFKHGGKAIEKGKIPLRSPHSSSSSMTASASASAAAPLSSLSRQDVQLETQRWFMDLEKLSNDELLRMYNTMLTGKYDFAKHAWYIPLEDDKRCPIMVAKGYSVPQTPEKMIEFQDTAKLLEHEYQGFIDAWDFGHITKPQVQKALLLILESRSIEILETRKVTG